MKANRIVKNRIVAMPLALISLLTTTKTMGQKKIKNMKPNNAYDIFDGYFFVISVTLILGLSKCNIVNFKKQAFPKTPLSQSLPLPNFPNAHYKFGNQ